MRYLNMFVLIGIALVLLGVAGLATHNRFLIEPGQAENQRATILYLGAGLLMLLNGYVSARQYVPPVAKKKVAAPQADKP